MTKPEDITQEDWDAAYKASNAKYDPYTRAYVVDIARAIMAAKADERELAAQIAKVYADEHAQMAVDALDLNKPLDLAGATQVSIVAGQIVFAIRNRDTV